MAKITGVHHYEERMLCLLLLLRMPRTRVIYVTSTPLSETIIDYYLHLLPGVPGVRRRLTLVSCDDASPTALTRKILERPQVIAQIAKAIPDLASAHMTCFTVSELERKLALALGLPIYGCNPSLLHWGSKSGSRSATRRDRSLSRHAAWCPSHRTLAASAGAVAFSHSRLAGSASVR
jgi:hypothetical protein